MTTLSPSEISARLADMLTLSRDWDGYDTEPPSVEAIEAARRFLVKAESIRLAPVRVAPLSAEGVGVRFAGLESWTGHVEFYNRQSETACAICSWVGDYPDEWEPEVFTFDMTDAGILATLIRISLWLETGSVSVSEETYEQVKAMAEK